MSIEFNGHSAPPLSSGESSSQQGAALTEKELKIQKLEAKLEALRQENLAFPSQTTKKRSLASEEGEESHKRQHRMLDHSNALLKVYPNMQQMLDPQNIVTFLIPQRGRQRRNLLRSILGPL